MFRVWFEFGGVAMSTPPVEGTFESRGAAHAALRAAGYIPDPDEDGGVFHCLPQIRDLWSNDHILDEAYQFAEVLISP